MTINQVLGMPREPVGSQNSRCNPNSKCRWDADTSGDPCCAIQFELSSGASTALPNSPGVSSGSGVKRAHGDSVVNDDGEQPGTRARISALITGLHGVDAAEDDEISSGDGIIDEWLSSWHPETHMSQKMVIEAKRQEMEKFKRMKVYRVVTRESMERDEEGKMIASKWVITNKGTEEHPIAKARPDRIPPPRFAHRS